MTEFIGNFACFVALPSGFGTLEETLEVLTWGDAEYMSDTIKIARDG